jgi:hypothetical protein
VNLLEKVLVLASPLSSLALANSNFLLQIVAVFAVFLQQVPFEQPATGCELMTDSGFGLGHQKLSSLTRLLQVLVGLSSLEFLSLK